MMRTPFKKLIPGLFALALAGCKGESSGKILVRFLEAPDVGGAWAQIIESFERANPSIDVVMVEGPAATNAREDMYATAFLTGADAYDVVYMDVVWVAKFAAQDWLLPLDSFINAEELDNFLPGDMAGSYYQGRLYRVPAQADAGVLYYRKDLLEQHGIRPPETFDELLALARRFHHPPEFYGLVFQGKQYEGLTCNFLEYLWGMGGELFNEDGTVAVGAPARQALGFMTDLIRKHELVPKGILTYQEEESRHLFQEGKALFMRNWPYAYTLMQQEGSPVRGKVGLMPMVKKKGASPAATLGGWGLGVARFSKNPAAALAFIRYATSPEAQKLRYLKSGLLPTQESLYRDSELLKSSPHLKDIHAILIKARPRPVHPQYARISDAVQKEVSAALAGKIGPDNAVANMERRLKEIVR